VAKLAGTVLWQQDNWRDVPSPIINLQPKS
jgi:hypothetical protein